MEFLSSLLPKIARLLVTPDFLIVCFLLVSYVTFSRYRKLSRSLFAVVLSLMLSLTFFPVGEWLIYPLEVKYITNPKLPKDIDGIIMLAGGEELSLSIMWQQMEFDKAVERNLYFLKYMRQYSNAQFYFSGSGGIEHHRSSKELVLQLADLWGLKANKISFELDSTTTMQSVKNLLGLIKPKKSEKWLVITSAWHMPRTKILFDHYGWEVIPFPVDHLSHKERLFRINLNLSENLAIFKIAIKEWVGILVYQFLI